MCDTWRRSCSCVAVHSWERQNTRQPVNYPCLTHKHATSPEQTDPVNNTGINGDEKLRNSNSPTPVYTQFKGTLFRLSMPTCNLHEGLHAKPLISTVLCLALQCTETCVPSACRWADSLASLRATGWTQHTHVCRMVTITYVAASSCQVNLPLPAAERKQGVVNMKQKCGSHLRKKKKSFFRQK